MELIIRMRLTIRSAKQSNKYGMMPYDYAELFFGVFQKHNSISFGPIQPSSPSTKQFQDLP